MTHTLHRYDGAHPPTDDFIVLAMPARGLPEADAVDMEKEFLRRALAHDPVNVGDSAHGGQYRPQRRLGPSVHWRREDAADPETVVERLDRKSAVSAVFDDMESVCAFLAELKEDPPGLSINLSTSVEQAREVCRRVGLTRHSVEYSLGFVGGAERLPREETLEMCTMCGHGMLSAALARKMSDRVRGGRSDPVRASRTMARFCNCGAFNPSRAERILDEATVSDAASTPGREAGR